MTDIRNLRALTVVLALLFSLIALPASAADDCSPTGDATEKTPHVLDAPETLPLAMDLTSAWLSDGNRLYGDFTRTAGVEQGTVYHGFALPILINFGRTTDLHVTYDVVGERTAGVLRAEVLAPGEVAIDLALAFNPGGTSTFYSGVRGADLPPLELAEMAESWGLDFRTSGEAVFLLPPDALADVVEQARQTVADGEDLVLPELQIDSVTLHPGTATHVAAEEPTGAGMMGLADVRVKAPVVLDEMGGGCSSDWTHVLEQGTQSVPPPLPDMLLRIEP